MAKVIISLITPSRGRHVYSPLRKHKFAVHFHLLCKCSCVCTMTSVCVNIATSLLRVCKLLIFKWMLVPQSQIIKYFALLF